MQTMVDGELWKKLEAPEKQSLIVPAGQQPFELIYLFQNSGGDCAAIGNLEYAVVRGWFKCHPRLPQLFRDLLALFQADKFEQQILPWREARKKTESARDFINIQRFPHIEDKRFSAVTLSRCMQDQAYGLGNGHEVSRRSRISDSNRSALLNLIAEKAEHAARTSGHVPETHAHEPGLTGFRKFSDY